MDEERRVQNTEKQKNADTQTADVICRGGRAVTGAKGNCFMRKSNPCVIIGVKS